MLLRWATDIHLDHLRSDKEIDAFCTSLVSGLGEGDAVVLTGDLSNAPQLTGHLRQLADACARAGCDAYFVLGNHDYYGSSIYEVNATAIAASDDRLRWLDVVSPVHLVSDDPVPTALVGVGGWADARIGNQNTPLLMTDFRLIDDLADKMAPGSITGWRRGVDRSALHAELRSLADSNASALRAQIGAAIVTGAKRIIVATHVPPWTCAAMHEGLPSSPDYTPYFVCTATGDVLVEAAGAHPEVQFEVLCGHSHGAGNTLISPNLRVRTGAAKYGHPAVAATFDLSIAGDLEALDGTAAPV